MTEFADLIEVVARRILGDPNNVLSTPGELRFGSRGSLSVKIDGPHKGTWRSHEENLGGGVLDLIAREMRSDRRQAMDWLKKEFPDIAGEPETSRSSRRIVATYPYHSETGDLLFEVIRFDPKDFRQRRPDGAGGTVWNLKGIEPVLYHLPEVIEAATMGRVIYIVEGEKDADRLWSMGIPATCNAGGAGKWRDSYAEYLVGADIVILPDNDETGQAHAETIAKSLVGKALRTRVVELPNLPRKGDVCDWLDAGGKSDTLFDIAEITASWSPRVITRFPSVYFGDEDKLPNITWLVKGLLVDGGMSAMFGGPGSSKSFLMLHAALSVAHGRDFFGQKVKHCGVVYVSGEGASGMRMRMKAWRQINAGQPRAPFVMIPTSVNLFDSDEEADALMTDIELHAQAMGWTCGLVIFDTLSRMIGSGDEDKARDINVVVQRAERIQARTGAHVAIVHHSGKDKDRGMRGSNALLGAVDAAIEVTQFESGLCEARVTKLKDGADLSTFRYTLSQSVLGQDEEGEDITSAAVTPTDASQGNVAGSKVKLTDAERIALDALNEALVAGGTPGRGGTIPHGVNTVPLQMWREYAYQRGLSSSDSPEARKKAFQRVRERLLGKGLVAMWGEVVWTVKATL